MTSLAEIDWQPILEGGDGPPVLVLVCTLIAAFAVVAVVQWRRVRIAEAEASLKMRMVDRGYSAEQIERVLQVRVKGGGRAGCCDDGFIADARSTV